MIKCGLLDLDGKQILSCSYDDINIITPHFFFCREGSDVYLYNDSETKLGILESEDYITLYNINDLNFETPLSLSDNCFVGDEVIFIKQDEKYAMFNKNGFQIKDYIFNYLDFIYHENSNDAVFKVSEENGEEYLINTNGDKIFDVLDTNIYGYYNGLLLIEDTNGFGVIDLERNIIIAPEYPKIIIYDNYIWVKVTDNKFNIYDVNGNLLFKDMKNVVMGGNGEYFVLRKNDKVLVTINVCIILLTVVIIIFSLKNIFNFKRKKIVKKEKSLDNNE